MDGHFFATMDSDVEAMLTYIGTKQEGLARGVAALVVRAQQAGLIDQDGQPPNAMFSSTLSQVCVVMSQLGSLLSGYLVQCAAYSQLTMILSGSLALAADMARELEVVTEEANELLSYIDINVAGMRKLLKQHDKQIPVEYQKRPIGSPTYIRHHRLLTDGVLRAVTELNKVRTSIEGLFQVLQAVNAPGLEQLGSLPAALAEVHLGSEYTPIKTDSIHSNPIPSCILTATLPLTYG
ncbi:hypothetical protein Pmar_PMAR001973 [Perkinsus marinus ATCC 50983]|uniref:SPX domain-containing protein n=1 Tax=Perkinsus marinus (strain ATCC 50983 / TXsc) TaxID=423536 RepID=C5LYC0_PERM5|nr:hypothetical protein Pmar_PMAR001973 [Perkinsus marinus ATCC 50983]EEQ98158.1 hypothetical protein Pmar_PMAR001973 [Perkinsus marinus ATCC 50983]|eukprot:XP_002765441.1 hypothetical protein Pmar_PMAR001973 [Perkinsus marinus ATCC 50983]